MGDNVEINGSAIGWNATDPAVVEVNPATGKFEFTARFTRQRSLWQMYTDAIGENDWGTLKQSIYTPNMFVAFSDMDPEPEDIVINDGGVDCFNIKYLSEAVGQTVPVYHDPDGGFWVGGGSSLTTDKVFSFEISADLSEMKIVSVKDAEVNNDFPEYLYLLGDATPGGWELDKATRMENLGDGIYRYVGELKAGGAEDVIGLLPQILPLLEQDRGFSLFAPHTYHVDIRFETGFTQMSTLADAITLALAQNREGQLPYAAAVLAGLFLLLHGTYHKKCALRLSCRTASAAAEPYVLTLDEGKWNGRDTYCKWSGAPEGFGSQIQMDDGAQRIYRAVCPVLLLACVLLSLLASYGLGKPGHLLWCLSASFTASAALGGALVYSRPLHKVARRLAQSGAALAGWPGMAQSKKGDRVLITDGDLFPPGYVELNGIKVFGDWSIEKVVGCTATLIRDSGSGLTKLFHDLLRAQGAIFRRAEDLNCYEGGGLSAHIRGEQVLVGSAAFMNLMEVKLPQGLHVKNAVFCAIDGELAGIFALNYTLPDTVFPALDSLLREKVGPVLATRDFNLIPAMLHQRFKLAADKMDFPPVERRRELSDPDQPHSAVITAVLCREGLLPCADAVVGAKRLRWAARFGAGLTCVGSALGVLLAYYLTSVDAYGSLSPLNLLIFLLFWLAPVWFLTSWVPRY